MAARSTMRIVGKILKYMVVAVVFAVMIFMIWRVRRFRKKFQNIHLRK